MKIHRAIINNRAWSCLTILGTTGALADFYLSAGTACGLLLGHRRSNDFNFFSRETFSTESILIEIKHFGISIEKKEDNTLIFIMNDVLFSFLYYPFKLLREPVIYKYLTIASLEDVGCMKLDSIATHGKKRDFIDLYFICKKIPLQNLVQLFKEKYKDSKTVPLNLAKNLIFFNYVDKEPMPLLIKKIKWEKIKDFFIQEVKKTKI
jgi:Nucleotidyl transferase AbiEii toxin, Type IV TA system